MPYTDGTGLRLGLTWKDVGRVRMGVGGGEQTGESWGDDLEDDRETILKFLSNCPDGLVWLLLLEEPEFKLRESSPCWQCTKLVGGPMRPLLSLRLGGAVSVRRRLDLVVRDGNALSLSSRVCTELHRRNIGRLAG